eukprot:TRINITY_DN67764_c0_g1_i1.p1 TRINITY_DN67764_c0_g1~~TRINITY_DN67764_c0_g1_i1.p1  ORF type:complete len:410 (-),score=85.43 TRINITY_DN67764_c0_g1_i1:56-1261(-)
MDGAGNSFLTSTSERADLNQYWFSPGTVAAFVAEVSEAGGSAALVSTPSVYFSLPNEVRHKCKVFDFDRQWDLDPGYVFYDFNEPEALAPELRNAFDFVLIDPPFITVEVWQKYATTAKLLARDGARLLCTTIAENKGLMQEILGLGPALFRPSIPTLVYQYSIYVNYKSERLEQLNPEIDDEDWQLSTAPTVAATGSGVEDKELPRLAAAAVGEARVAGVADVAAASHSVDGSETRDASLLPPEAVLLGELRERLAALKRALEAMQAPLQSAVRRRAAGGAAADAAATAAAVAVEASAERTIALEAWLETHGLEVAVAMNERPAAAPTKEATDRWHLKAVWELLAKAQGNQISSLAAYQEFAMNSRQSSSALFRQSNQVLDRIKAIKKAASAAIEAPASA